MLNQYYKIFITLFFLVTYSFANNYSQEDKLYNKFIDAKFNNEIYCQKLGELGTPKAKSILLKIFSDSSFIERKKALAGLFYFKDDKTRRLLINSALSDFMLSTSITDKIKKNSAGFTPIVIQTYKTNKKKNERKILLTMLSENNSSTVIKFIKNIINSSANEDKIIALDILIDKKNPEYYDYIKNLQNEIIFRTQVLYYILNNGTVVELPLFLKIIKNNESTENVLISYKAVEKWGNEKLKTDIFSQSLNNERLASISLQIFENTNSQTIKEKTIILAKSANNQNTRIIAGKYLLKYKSINLFPYIIPILKEKYKPNNNYKVKDAIASIVTLGISGIFQGFSRKKTKSKFYIQQKNVAAELNKIAGTDIGYSYDIWKKYLIFRGFTIEDQNIFQYLFSNNKETRKKAINATINILGYKDQRAFFVKYPTLIKVSEKTYLLKLSDLLIDKLIKNINL